jgi:hypothetical protein
MIKFICPTLLTMRSSHEAALGEPRNSANSSEFWTALVKHVPEMTKMRAGIRATRVAPAEEWTLS